jgi:hypothetical protein
MTDPGKNCGHLEPKQESVISKSVISDRKIRTDH